jgi:secreted trypsin-like serine protease
MQRTSSLLLPSCLALVIAHSSIASAQPAPVVGGKKSPAGKWDDVVAVIGTTGVCSGTLIAPDVVMTAGHCIDTDPYEVITNTTDYARSGGDHIPVKWSRAFPEWFKRYDIGILMLEHVARPTPRPIAAACLASDRLSKASPLTIVGFGLTTPSGQDDNTELNEATIPVLDPMCEGDPSCEVAVRPGGEFTAGGRGTDSCFGDSGGPAFLDTPAGPVLVGVVSRGLALPGQPCGNGGVYVRADKVVAWAQRVTDRKFTRTTCAGDDRPSDDPEASQDAQGGCSTAPGAGGIASLGCLAAGLALVLRRRRSEARLR